MARTYGNWRLPRSGGLFGLGQGGTFAALGGLGVVMVLVMLTGNLLLGAVSVGVLAGLVWLVVTKDKHGQSIGGRIMVRGNWWRRRKARSHIYRAGPLGRVPFGKHRLPGVAVGTELHEGVDLAGRKFAFLRLPAAGAYSVPLVTEPDGSALVDEAQIESWVANWGGFLAHLSDEPGLVAVSVTIETVPDSGARLRRAVEGRFDPQAPGFARRVMDQILDSYPAGSSTVTAYISLTYESTLTPDGFADEIGTRLPGLSEMLTRTGAGASHPVAAGALCELVRVAFDPAAATQVDEIFDNGQRLELDWSEVGPVAAVAGWDYFAHDSGLSVTWEMTDAPRGLVYSNVLAQLLAPHRDIARKRVTLLYRPIDSARAAELVERDVAHAAFNLSSSKRAKARAQVDVASAKATSIEEAQGAGLVNFGALITATVLDEAGLAKAKAAVSSLTASARMRVRPYFGAQDAAFVAGLPLGIVLSDFTTFKGQL